MTTLSVVGIMLFSYCGKYIIPTAESVVTSLLIMHEKRWLSISQVFLLIVAKTTATTF